MKRVDNEWSGLMLKEQLCWSPRNITKLQQPVPMDTVTCLLCVVSGGVLVGFMFGVFGGMSEWGGIGSDVHSERE